MIEIGVLSEDEAIELLGGQLVVRQPELSPHATAVRLVDEALCLVFGPGWNVRASLPVALDDDSDRNPTSAWSRRSRATRIPGGPS